MNFDKKFLYIVGGVIFLFLTALGVYFIVSSRNNSTPDDINGNTSGNLPIGETSNRNTNNNNAEEDGLPAFFVSNDIVERTFTWQYQNKNYSISMNLYNSVHDFYKEQSKGYVYLSEIPSDYREEYYGMFVDKFSAEDFSTDIVRLISSQADADNLSEDQTVELMLAFVQSIPNDNKKAQSIASRSGGEVMQYPYETIFENKGVSFDKSFLLVSLLREFGYGASIFAFNNENHIAVGVQCPAQFANYSSGYCFMETTNSRIEIGSIPNLESYSGNAIGKESTLGEILKLGNVEIYQKSQGWEYRRIAKSSTVVSETDTELSLAELKAEEDARAEARKKELAPLKAEIERLGLEIRSGDIFKDASQDRKDEMEDIKKNSTDCFDEALYGSDSENNQDVIECIQNSQKDVNDYKVNASKDNLESINDYMDKLEEYTEKLREYNSKSLESGVTW